MDSTLILGKIERQIKCDLGISPLLTLVSQTRDEMGKMSKFEFANTGEIFFHDISGNVAYVECFFAKNEEIVPEFRRNLPRRNPLRPSFPRISGPHHIFIFLKKGLLTSSKIGRGKRRLFLQEEEDPNL